MNKPFIFALISGFVLIFAFPPFGMGLIAWVAFVPLFLALDWVEGGTTPKKGLFLGWISGFIFFLGTAYWVVHSMYFYGGVPLSVGILVMLLLVAYLALFPALFCFCFVLTSGYSTGIRLFLVPCIWVTLEYLRGRLFTGFPWVLLGYSQADFLTVIQISEITGVWGVSFLVMSVNTLLFLYFAKGRSKAPMRRRLGLRGGFRLPLKETLVTVVLFISTLVYGLIRIDQVDSLTTNWPTLKVGIAQGNIDQSIKWDPAFQENTVETYMGLTDKAIKGGAVMIVWPETAVPFYLETDNDLGPVVRKLPSETGSYLLTGSPSYSYNIILNKYSSFNSAYLLSPHGGLPERYDKVHLVPFGEYVPFKRFLPFIDKLVVGVGDFTPGAGYFPLKFNGQGIGILICYEAIFPEISRSFVKGGSTLLANLTNDAWFGDTSAPYQHFEMALFRAVENRVFLIRSANTGISAIVDPVGRVKLKSGLFAEQTLTGEVRFREGPPGFYSWYGDIFPVLCIVVSGLFIVSRFRRRLRNV
jgi:apolipoprotein N-acyltransferase